MLRVRIPPEPLGTREDRSTTSSPCRAARSARHPVKVERPRRAGVPPGVQIPSGALEDEGRYYLTLESLFLQRVGWALVSPGGRNPPAPSFAGSTPARRTAMCFDFLLHGPVVYRFRTPLSQSGQAGSTPVRAASLRLPFSSRGPAATTPLLQRGNGGSIPSGTTRWLVT